MPDIAPKYFDDLERRIGEGIVTADVLAEEDPDYDGAVPIPYHNDDGYEWWDAEEGRLLEEQLFPPGSDAHEAGAAARGLALVGLHSALESYARGVGIPPGREPLPRAIRAFLSNKRLPALDSDLADLILMMDEVRHLVVHHRGVVSDRFINNVPNNRLILGEFRPVAIRELLAFADAVWATAAVMRAAHMSSG